MKPLVSIVIPCYKGERYLPEAIESCLKQTHLPLEVIVVDDASPDRCGDIAEEYARKDSRVQVIRLRRNGGVSGAFNAGFDAASGEYMARIAQDDVFDANAIAAMAQHLAAHPTAGLVYCNEQQIDEHGVVLSQLNRPEPGQVLLEGNKVGLCVMWRRKVWETVGKFDSRFDTAEDYEYWLRVRERFEIIKCGGAPMLSVRIHSEMGSRVYSGKQEVLAARIRARYDTNGWFAGKKILQKGYFEAAYNYRQKGQRGFALKYAMAALFQWPFDGRLYRLMGSILLGKRG